ncbi:TRAP transporter substrate-binding protein [Rhodobacter sp. 24-YEA-8]|uniref:TRAP transporter substrate-binding protein n=1 Tax=Rhodobacter sp. 24-YEA-8 TaxID=1884310 RepID=UPI0008956ED1|nr:TRAP transporter substrate-binding protein [Rhodobacter sp. 24-YEA-8]SED50727.1 TRAP-type C4-dicarboxylate transport system, substrate-binding protein [Rhodobacter sp. 24-YEA-8]
MFRSTIAAAVSALFFGGAATAQEITLSAGTEGNQDGLYYATLTLLDEELRARTEGRVGLRIYPNQQLGDELSMIEGLRSGSLDIAVVGGANFATYVPQLQLFSVPYIFADYQVYRAAMAPDSPVWTLLEDQVAAAGLGISLKAPSTVGSRWVANSKGEISSPADMAKLAPRMRVQANPIESEVWSTYGASPVNLPMPEVVAAMRQGVVQAVENAPDVLFTYKLHEVANYISKTDHSFYVALVIASDTSLAKIPEDLRDEVEAAFDAAGQRLLDLSLKFQERAIEGLIKGGAVISEVDIPAFRAPLAAFYERVATEADAIDLLTAIRGL